MSSFDVSNANCDLLNIDSPRRVVERQLAELISASDPDVVSKFLQSPCLPQRQSAASLGLLKFVMDISKPGEWQERFNDAYLDDDMLLEAKSKQRAEDIVLSLVDRETKARLAFRVHRDRFTSQIWHCCKRICFTTITIDVTLVALLEELLLIHEHAEQLHAARENLSGLIEKRKKGVGTSTVAFASMSREERESASHESTRTNRQEHLQQFRRFAEEVLPFLYATTDSPRGTARPPYKLCTQAICCLLGVSRNFLYSRKLAKNQTTGHEEVLSIVDSAGMRMRQHRRIGLRIDVPAIESLPEYECGCHIPCFAEVPTWVLVSEYNEFEKLSKDLHPRHRENRFLLNRMYTPLTNSTTSICNQALAALYNVSTTLIADVRLVLDSMCAGSSSFDRSLVSDGSKRYKYKAGHPANYLPDWVREKVENNLDYILRADPAGATGDSVCRVYSPEINTQEKLRITLKESLTLDDCDEELSASTLQRMINSYLRNRKFDRISFTQSDHNACPTCKCLQYAVMEYHHEARVATRELKGLYRYPRPLTHADAMQVQKLSDVEKTKNFQEEQSLEDLRVHTGRDKRIREMVMTMCDYFRSVENRYRSQDSENLDSPGRSWNSYLDRARVTHQDDMTKVDLPHFIVTASSDITRWRFEVNAHVNVVTNDAVIFSHEQGSGPKNASVIIEEILLEHLLQCKGESIKVVISDNASVGKNWLTTVAFPQYVVDQGLAEICLIIFLENNHGKYLADMLFGQFQTKRKRQTLLGIDDLLLGFEGVKRRTGNVQGFALNPLSSVNFCEILSSLGYQTSPPSDFGFVKRNIHFACACVPGTKKRLSLDLKRLIGPMLPDEAGMVRISTEPPNYKPQDRLPFEDRFVDIPAACLPQTAKTRSGSKARSVEKVPMDTDRNTRNAPLVVPLDKGFAENGNGVVSSRTAEKVGYNGIGFLEQNACPELRQRNAPVVQRAWPPALFDLFCRSCSVEPVPEGESTKCAPENWIIRKPVSHFCSFESGYKARYPPRNMMNARFGKGPRETKPWVPIATYYEPPFPLIEKTSAHAAMTRLASHHNNIAQSIHVLHALREVFGEMDGHDDTVDPWMHRKATIPCQKAIERYKNELQTFIEREKGHPKAPKGLKQIFREDRDIAKQVDRIEREERVKHPLETEAAKKKARNQTFARLFSEAQKKPGEMDRFQFLVCKDHERYARELKEFRASRKVFDESHGLLPKSMTVDRQ